MLTEEQKQQILNSSNFQNLVRKPVIEQTTGLSFVERARQAREQTALPTTPTLPTQKKEGFFDKIKETGRDIKETVGDVGKTIGETKEKIGDIVEGEEAGEQGKWRSFAQAFGTIAGGVAKAGGDIVKGGVKAVLSQEQEEGVKKAVAETIETVAPIAKKIDESIGSPAGTFIESYKNLDDKSKRDIDSLLGISSLSFDIATAGTTKKIGEIGVKKGAKVFADTAKATKKVAGEVAEEAIELGGKAKKVAEKGLQAVTPKAETIEAVTQVAKETAERIPRVAERVKGAGEEAIERAKRIRTSEPAVANAIKANVDDKVIETISKADEATRRAYKQVIDIAEESPKTIGSKTQPSKVSGDLAVKQYDLINKQKKSVGKSIGEEVDKLSKTVKVDMTDGISKADNLLDAQGVKVIDGKLDFKGSNFTPAERTKINELYNLAVEGGDSLSPAQIRGKDNLFSKLQREAKMEGIGNIIIKTDDGNKSLFSVFRDIFSDKLDTVSPEIKKLNKEYRNLILITDDIDSSILKTPNFNATKSADPAEFAKVNMRRIFGEAQSSPAFEAVADQMDALARQLGYKEATPKQIAEFAIELRKLYPETIPKAGFQGGIAGGIKAGALDAVSKIVKAGTPDLADKRKALKELLEFYLGKQ